MRRCSFVLVSLFFVACGPTPGNGNGNGNGDGPDAANNSRSDARPQTEFVDASPPQACDKMDILFVVDNSGSMGDEQTNLAANFPQFISVLNGFSNLDWRVAVTSTGRDYSYNMSTPIGNIPNSQTGGDNGALLQRCDMTKRWVDKTDPDPSTTFACAAEIGTGGPNDEMPLASIKQAFTERLTDGTNTGFKRDDALLAVVILTDEDDCSYEQSVNLGFTESLCDDMMEPVQNYAAFMDTFTGAAGRWAVAVIAGPGPGNCSSSFGTAQEATRLKDFAARAGTNGIVGSICDGDLSQPLADAINTFETACQNLPPID